MFVKYDKNVQNVPLKIWHNENSLGEQACQQAINASKLPFLHKHVALMPDAHMGYGVPIGCVFASNGYIVPHAVGVDIGCGMAYTGTNIEADRLINTETANGLLGEKICGRIRGDIPVGKNRHSEKQESEFWLDYYKDSDCSSRYHCEKLKEEFEKAFYSLGTLGSGNHFIELQRDTETGLMGIMIHSGSRHFGYVVAKHFSDIAKDLNDKWFSDVPPELHYLPLEHEQGKAYRAWMNMALNFAYFNRRRMMNITKDILKDEFDNIEFNSAHDVHHNYAAMENHYNQNVMVHRKGAIRVREGETGIIPGAMGGKSYIVRGKGNAESFHSASHGAGRVMGRNEAKRTFSAEQMMNDLKERNVILSTPNKADALDEFRKAYKNIENVLKHEEELIKPIHELETVCVIKG